MANILCVDDEPAAVALKKRILERAGHAVTTSSSANEAIGLLQKEKFDAVVTDWKSGGRERPPDSAGREDGSAGAGGSGLGLLHRGISRCQAAS